jgi:hypothetical protein
MATNDPMTTKIVRQSRMSSFLTALSIWARWVAFGNIVPTIVQALPKHMLVQVTNIAIPLSVTGSYI